MLIFSELDLRNMPPDVVRQLREIRKDDYVEDETAVSGTELNILELTVTFPVYPSIVKAHG